MADESNTIRGRLLRWGNSYGIRVRKQDADRIGVRPGEEVSIRLERQTEIDEVLSRLPLVRDPDPEASVKHDEYLGKAREERLRRVRSQSGGS